MFEAWFRFVLIQRKCNDNNLLCGGDPSKTTVQQIPLFRYLRAFFGGQDKMKQTTHPLFASMLCFTNNM